MSYIQMLGPFGNDHLFFSFPEIVYWLTGVKDSIK